MTAQLEQLSPSFRTDPEAAYAAYQELGYHVEYGVWTPEECEALVRAARQFESFREGRCAPLMNPHRQDPLFLTALRKPAVVRVMERLIGGPVSGLQTQFFFCQPGTRGFARHQDNYFVEAKQEVFGSAWAALQDVTPDMGGLVVYPRTHREAILPVANVPDYQPTAHQCPNANREQAVLPPGYRGVDMAIPQGAVVFLHGHTVHSSHDNQSDRFRHALLMTYIRRGEHFRPGKMAGRAEVDVYAP